MEYKEIQDLIKFVAKSGASEVEIEIEDLKSPLKQSSKQRNCSKLSL